ncbi:virulence RhuM family protein [Patescibacteria group bacterium]|nr:virulence RhuM family protein [Patescibacteria group bacterium]
MKKNNSALEKFNNFVIFQTENGKVNIDVFFQNETLWLTQKKIAELFEVNVPAISKHLKNIFETGELDEKVVVSILENTTEHGAIEGKTQTKSVKYYNLKAITAVGYRVNSHRATEFRKWATEILHEYIIKGFAMDDERLKQGGGRVRYFAELLQRIRDIRSSERNFYQKVTDIYATSIDYKKDDEMTKKFFATVQNKMHYAVHGQTAAEMIERRVDNKKPFMGLTNFKGDYITVDDIIIAKNYLSETEIKKLNLIVSLFFDFAELQAMEEIPMKMIDWIKKLDEFLKASGKKLLDNAGIISHERAIKKANSEFVKYRKEQDKNYISDFDREVKKLLKKTKK